MPRHQHWLTRPLIAYLHWRQPITRGWARYAVRLKNKIMKGEATGYARHGQLPFDPASRDTLLYWNYSEDRLHLLRQITAEVQKAGWRSRVDSGWNRWDVEIYGSRYAKVRITTATEDHGNNGRMTRVRVEQYMSKFCLVLLIAMLMLCTLLLVHMWPFSRPAVLLPMAIFCMYLVNRRQVVQPILGLIDEAAESAGFLPILPKKPQAQATPAKPAKPQPAGDLDEEEDGLAHV
jgi:hypothetical protein